MSIATTRAFSSKKIMLIVAAAVAAVAVGAFFALQSSAPQTVSAANPSDFGLSDGDRVTAQQLGGDPDIYVVKETHIQGYKRNFQNPTICNYYGHFGQGGCFAAGLKQITAAVRDALPTSCYYTNAENPDGKVWFMQATGADAGMLRHVQVDGAAAIAADANFFLKVFNMNTLEQNFYSVGAPITSMSDVPTCLTGETLETPTPTPTPGAVSVMLAPGNPAAATITGGASGVEMLRVRLSGTGTVSTMTFKRYAAGATGDFSNVYVYDGATRLTSGKSLSAATGEVTFINLNTSVSETKDLSLVGDMNITQTAGNVSGFQLLSVGLSSGTVSGTPISGNLFTISGTDSGDLDVSKVGSGFLQPSVGQRGAQLTEFKLTSNVEGSWVKRITLLQGGTVKSSDITNIKLKTGTTEWSGSVTSTGYLVFDLGSGHFIAKGAEAVFKVYGDLTGKKDEDINLYFEYPTDLWAVGDQYGFGMYIQTGSAGNGISDLDAASDAHDVTLQGGVLTITLDNSLGAQNIGTNTSDTVLMKYTMTAASNIEVRKTKWVLCADTDADGDFDDADDAEVEGNWDDLTDFKVIDEDTGTTIMGPKDGTSFDDGDNSNATCSATNDGAMEYFTDVYELMAGRTYRFKVTADINTANGGFLDASDAVKIGLVNFTAATGLAGSPATPDVTVMKYSGTNTAVADADITPQADLVGPVMTLQASSLTLGLSSSINDQTFVRGTQGITAAGLTFRAANASDMKVTDIVLTGYHSDDNSTFAVGVTGTETIADMVSGVSLYEIESGAPLATTPTSNQLSNSTGTVTFNAMNWNIPAGATRTLGIKVNLGSNALADTDYFAFDINTTTDVTALDNSSKTVNAGNADPNGATSPTTVVSVANSGSLAAAVSTANTPRDHAVYWGQTGDIAGVWRFTSTTEAQYLEKLQFGEYDAGGTQETDLATNAKTVYLEYRNKTGTLLTESSTLSAAGTTSFGFHADTDGTGPMIDNRPYVPKDSSLDVTIKVDYKTKTEGATSGKTWDFDFIPNTSSGTSMFKASGEGSGVVIDGQDSGFTAAVDQDTAGTDIINYRVFPEFALVAPTATKLSTVDPVVTFTVTARGLPESRIFFDGTAAGSGSIKFEVIASGVGITADPNFTVRKSDGVIVDTGSITDAPASALASSRASLSIDFGTLDVEIAGGSTQTFKVYLDTVTDFNTPINTTAGIGSDYFQLVLQDDVASLINWVDNSTNSSNDLDTQSTAGYLSNLPMSGYQFTAQ